MYACTKTTLSMAEVRSRHHDMTSRQSAPVDRIKYELGCLSSESFEAQRFQRAVHDKTKPQRHRRARGRDVYTENHLTASPASICATGPGQDSTRIFKLKTN